MSNTTAAIEAAMIENVRTAMRKNEDTAETSSRTLRGSRVGRALVPTMREVVWSLSLASPIAGLVVGFGLLSEPSVYVGALIGVTVLPVAAVVLAQVDVRKDAGPSVLGPAYVALGIFVCYWLLLMSVADGNPTEFARSNATLFGAD